MRYYVTVGGRTFEVELAPEGVRIDGEAVTVDLAEVGGTAVWHVIVDGRARRFVAARNGRGSWDLHLGGRRLVAEVVDERTRALRELTGGGRPPRGPRPVRAPMPGLVVRVEVAEGDRVEPGRGLVIVEAMKMENELRAEVPGIVTRVHVAEGDAVEKDQVLVELGPLDGG